MKRYANRIPNYLKKNIIEQDYASYTPQNHATWRYIMRRARHFFKDHAVSCYEEGLKKTGITIDRIPSIEEIDEKLSKFGWGAIGVCGFIPPAAFIDFQARQIMPIAMDMRTIQHTAYTPAPDIVHEAAGHVPILVDPAFRKYLTHYAHLADKAIITSEDVVLYEAIRFLSDVKENPDASKAKIEKAEAELRNAYGAMTQVSEASQLARLAWWTTEYGLVGSCKNPKIYGAGLLSSVGESEKCLSAKVKKIPLTLECLQQPYDITEPQPQLFVAKSMAQLPKIVEEVEKKLAFKMGGVRGLDLAKKAKSVNTVEVESKFAVSGHLTDYQVSRKGALEFLKFSGPVQLSYQKVELAGHSRARHGDGFSSPFGRWKDFPDKDPQKLTDVELITIGLIRGKRARLELVSGFVIEGTLLHILRKDKKLFVLTWHDCRVTCGDKLYFDPNWGVFDQVVGTEAVSIYSGPADRDAFGEYETGHSSSSPGRTSPYTDCEWSVFELYRKLRQIREGKLPAAKMMVQLGEIADLYTKMHREEWLLGIEMLELATQKFPKQNGVSWKSQVEKTVQDYAEHGKGADAHSIPRELIQHGLELLSVRD